MSSGQTKVREAFLQHGGTLWSGKAILLKLTEELGELTRAFRKGSLADVHHEYGDLLFTVLALAERCGLNVDTCLHSAIHRFNLYCESDESRKSSRVWLEQRGEEVDVPKPSCCSSCGCSSIYLGGLCYECYSSRRSLCG